ncbi:MAG: type II secretion system protein [Verrucomicrobia bacterium]|nr:type II secretion system protein [Verrucomicrobiota bacterium]
MNRSHTSSSRAFTLSELVVVIATVALMIVLAGLFLQDRTKTRDRAARISCVGTLMNINLAFRIWSNDHNERFPWQVSEAEGGTLPNDTPIGSVFGSLGDVYSCLSNELTLPNVLVCPDDST